MDCKQVEELLPGYLNGMLDADHQKQVEEHLAQCAACQQEREETLLMSAIYQQHVPTAVLADYAFERPLETFERGLVERHVQTCSSCAEELALAQEGHRSLEEEPLAAKIPWWQRWPWRDRGQTGTVEPETLPHRTASGLGFWLTSWRNPAWVFSSLCLIITGIAVYKAVTLSKAGQHRDAYYESLAKQDQAIIQEKEATIAQLNRQIAELSTESARAGASSERLAEFRQKADTLAKELEQHERTIRELQQRLEQYRRPGAAAVAVALLTPSRELDQAKTIEFTKDTLFLYLQARVSSAEDYDRYRLVITDASKRVVAQTDHARKGANNLVSYLLAREQLKPGTYTLAIYAGDRTEKDPIAMDRFRIIARP